MTMCIKTADINKTINSISCHRHIDCLIACLTQVTLTNSAIKRADHRKKQHKITWRRQMKEEKYQK